MSEEKRAQLIAAGRLNEDGSRKNFCPTCGHELTNEEYQATIGAVVAQSESVALGVKGQEG